MKQGKSDICRVYQLQCGYIMLCDILFMSCNILSFHLSCTTLPLVSYTNIVTFSLATDLCLLLCINIAQCQAPSLPSPMSVGKTIHLLGKDIDASLEIVVVEDLLVEYSAVEVLHLIRHTTTHTMPPLVPNNKKLFLHVH